jgi:hypothetical protein
VLRGWGTLDIQWTGEDARHSTVIIYIHL